MSGDREPIVPLSCKHHVQRVRATKCVKTEPRLQSWSKPVQITRYWMTKPSKGGLLCMQGTKPTRTMWLQLVKVPVKVLESNLCITLIFKMCVTECMCFPIMTMGSRWVDGQLVQQNSSSKDFSSSAASVCNGSRPFHTTLVMSTASLPAPMVTSRSVSMHREACKPSKAGTMLCSRPQGFCRCSSSGAVLPRR